MILTNQQKFIVEATKQLQYLRVRQLHAMLQAHYGPKGVEIGEHRMSTMLRQLRTASNCIFLQDDLVTYGHREISEHYLEAIDVMLELTENAPTFLLARPAPGALSSPLWRRWGDAWIALHCHMAGHSRPRRRAAPHEGGAHYLDH